MLKYRDSRSVSPLLFNGFWDEHVAGDADRHDTIPKQNRTTVAFYFEICYNGIY